MSEFPRTGTQTRDLQNTKQISNHYTGTFGEAHRSSTPEPYMLPASYSRNN